MEEQIQNPQMMQQQGNAVEEEKSKLWIWLIVALVVIGVGIGIYFWLLGDSSPAVNLPGSGGSGGSIPQPPALPS